jgi:hypothetical protein
MERMEKILALELVNSFSSVANAENNYLAWQKSKTPKSAWDVAVSRARLIAYKPLLPSERKAMVEIIKFERI